MESRIETSELQQLVCSDGENDDSITQENTVTDVKIISPEKSNKMSSSGNTSHSSATKLASKQSGALPNPSLGGSRVLFVNEKRGASREPSAPKPATVRPRNVHKVEPPNGSSGPPARDGQQRHHCFLSEVPDVRHMERALLGLLADFHSGKLRAFGSGCTMEQMTNIRQQQERLARLHFDLGCAAAPSLNDGSLTRSHNTMAQLISRLEQLSVSIEKLHSNTDK